MLLLSTMDFCSPNLLQLFLVASLVLRQRNELPLELLMNRADRLQALSRMEADFILEAHRDIQSRQMKTHGGAELWISLIQPELGLENPNLGTCNPFPAAISLSQQCKTPAFTLPRFYILIFVNDA